MLFKSAAPVFRRGRELSCVYSRRQRRRRRRRSRHVFPKTFSAPFSSSPSRLVSRVAYLFFPADAVPIRRGKRFLVKTIFREYVCRAQSRAFPRDKRWRETRRDGQMFLAKWKYRYEASVCVCVCMCAGEIRECTLRGSTVAPPGEDGRVDESVYLAFCLASEGRKGLLSVL